MLMERWAHYEVLQIIISKILKKRLLIYSIIALKLIHLSKSRLLLIIQARRSLKLLRQTLQDH